MAVNTDTLIRDGSVPLWRQISDSLAATARTAEPGSRLPSERQLCEQFHVQRGTVQKAIDFLVARRVLERSPQLGTFVATARAATTVALLQFHLLGTDPIYLRHARGICEGLAGTGKKLLPLVVLPDGPSEDMMADSLHSMGVSGVIVDRFAVPADAPLITRLAKEFTVVAMNKEFIGAPVPCARLDPFQSAGGLVRYLAGQKVRTLIMFGGHPNNTAFFRRSEAFHAAAVASGYDRAENIWADEARLVQILDSASRPVGIHVLTPVQARQALILARQRGMVPGRDLFMATYGDGPQADLREGVAWAVLDEVGVGFAAAQLLLRRMDGKANATEIVNVPCRIVLPPADGSKMPIAVCGERVGA